MMELNGRIIPAAVVAGVLNTVPTGVGIQSIRFKEIDADGGNVYTVILTDSSTYEFTAPKGNTGATGGIGAAGFSPTVETAEIAGGHTVTISDAEAAHAFNVMDGADCDYSLVANALRKTLSGTAMRADDVSPLAHDLTVTQYGQCVQVGTPTPEAPIPITGRAAGATVGNGTTATPITLTVTDSHGDPVTLYGLPVTSGGNVTISGQQYVADTLEGTTLTRRVGSVDLGSLTWSLRVSGSANWHQTSDLLGIIKSAEAESIVANYTLMNTVGLRTQYFNGCTSGYTIGVSSVGALRTGGGGTIYADMSADDYAAAMSGVMLYYVLATPTTETVTLSPPTLAASTPTTTWTSEAYTDMTYNRDINAVVSELCAAIIALGGTI